MAGAVRDLFSTLESFMTDKTSRSRRSPDASDAYTAADIEVLEGLEPVRRRPGMYIGGTDEKAMHHLFAEVIDNSMDEAVAGHASRIEVVFSKDGFLSVADNGRGIPVDPHPKFKKPRARGHPHDAALGRKVREQGLQYLGRPARRRRLRRQCAVGDAARSRLRAASSSTPWSSSAASRRASSRSSARS